MHRHPLALLDRLPISSLETLERRLFMSTTIDEQYPADANAINVVTTYGVDNTGQTDVTALLQQAISQHVGNNRVLYLPNGTYLVSNTLNWKNTSGAWKGRLDLVGQSRDGVIIKLANNAPGFATSNKAVLFTASIAGATNNGSGNQAFANDIRNLTINTGTGNSKAIGVDYLANNWSSLQNVRITSGDGLGYAGINISRAAPGPALVKDVTIEGFDHGFFFANSSYHMTLENITLRDQRTVGIRNFYNNIAIHNLRSENTVPAIGNYGSTGYVTLVQDPGSPTWQLVNGSSSTNAIVNSGVLYVRDLVTSGYQTAIENDSVDVPGTTVAEYSSDGVTRLFDTSPQSALKLAAAETPHFWTNDFTKWANVQTYGARVDNSDDAAAIQAAIDSGAEVVYFPSSGAGTYRISQPIIIRGNVRKIVGMNSQLKPFDGGAFDPVGNTNPLFRVQNTNWSEVHIEDLQTSLTAVNGDRADTSFLHVADTTKLVFRRGVGNYKADAGAADVYLEDVVGGEYVFQSGQRAWARQLNPEGTKTFIQNHGAELWVFGMKTEIRGSTGIGSVLINHPGSRTEILGGYGYGTYTIPAGTAAFMNNEADLAFNWVTTTTSAASDYPVIVRETRGGVTRELLYADVPRNNSGSQVALYSGWEDGLIRQRSGDNYIAFEAEDHSGITDLGNDGRTWTPISGQGGASGGSALRAATTNGSSALDAYATYRLSFATAGTYSLYLRYSSYDVDGDGSWGGNNSLWTPNALNINPALTSNYTLQNSLGSYKNGTYGWTGALVTFTITAAQVGQEMLFYLGARETGLAVDRVVISQSSSLTQAQLNALANS
jgi:hypothetical protein